jgi:serine/threonine-protein kinase
MQVALETGALLGGYRIEELVGRGGMGVVYRATQLALDRQVALKVIAPELAQDEAFRQRFAREAKIAASIENAHVLPIYEAGESEDVLFLSMRYVDGCDLGVLLREVGALSPERAVVMVDQVAQALEVAHEHGLVHRDVKPTNVLIEARDGQDYVWLADFGLTKSATGLSGLSRAGEFVGTVDYASPEQIRGEPLDARSDVYSLGCLLFQALTNQPPFAQEDELARLWAHMHEQPPVVTEAVPGAPAELNEVVARALAKRPQDRYASAGDLGRAALAAVQGGRLRESEQRVAQAETSAEFDREPNGRLAPPRSKKRLLVGLAGGLLSLAVAAIFIVWVIRGSGAAGEERYRTETQSGPSAPGEVVGEPIAIESGVAEMDAGDGTVWAMSFDGVARQIDPSVNEVIGLPIRVTSGETHDMEPSLAVGEGAAWLAARNTVNRIDPRTQEIGQPIVFAPGETWVPMVAAGEGGVWIVAVPFWYAFDCEHDPEEGHCLEASPSKPRALVVRVDPESNQATTVGSISFRQRPRTPAVPIDVEIGEGAVWILLGDGTLRHIDPRTNVIGEPIPSGLGNRNGATALAVGDGTVWVLTYKNTVVRVDAATDRRVGSPIPVSTGNEFYIGQGLAFGEGSIWVTDISRNTVARIDADSKKVVGAPIGVPARPLDVVVGEGAVWVASELDQVVTRIDPSP